MLEAYTKYILSIYLGIELIAFRVSIYLVYPEYMRYIYIGDIFIIVRYRHILSIYPTYTAHTTYNFF